MSAPPPTDHSGPTDHPGPPGDLFAQHGLDAAGLLDTLGELPADTVVGLEPTDEVLSLHLAPVPDDPRGTVAGLFGLVAPPRWQAVAVGLDGWTDEHGDEDDEPEVRIHALLTRTGELATRVDERSGLPAVTNAVTDAGVDGAPTGLLVDCLHRVLGLSSPGSPPPAVDVALRTWAQSILLAHLGRDRFGWADAVRLHPGAPGVAAVAPSIETLVEATFRSAEDWDWRRVHRRARLGPMSGDLERDEVEWMDTTMYARWLTAHLADPLGVASVLESAGVVEVAERLRAVAEGVASRRSAPAAA